MKYLYESQGHSTIAISSEPSLVRHRATSTCNMFKLLVLSCLVATCVAGPFHLQTWIREGWHWRGPRGCADRAAGWAACAQVNATAALAPHPRDCRLFYYCSSVMRPVCRRCPLGLHFNPELQVCDWPNNANCTAMPRPPRPGHNATSPIPPTTILPTDAPSTNVPATDPLSTDTPSTVVPSTDMPSTAVHSTDLPSTAVHSTDLPSTAVPATDSASTDVTSIN